MRRLIMLLVAIGIVSGVTLGTIASRNPLRRPNAEIRDSLLREVPLGSSPAQVKELIERKRWHYKGESWGGVQSPQYALKGVHQMGAALGDYHTLFTPCHVCASWGFDHEQLVDVRVDSACDGI
jgi:hypothetical protein